MPSTSLTTMTCLDHPAPTCGITRHRCETNTPLTSFAGLCGPVFAPGALPFRHEALKRIEVPSYLHMPLEDVYQAWLRFEQLPHFMRAAEEGNGDGITPAWTLRMACANVPWEAVTVEKTPARRIAWRSTGGLAHRNRGSVTFQPGGLRSTKVTVTLEFQETGPMAVTEGTLRTLHVRLDRTLSIFGMMGSGGAALAPGSASL